MDDDQFLDVERKVGLIASGILIGLLCGVFWRELVHFIATAW